MRRGIKYLFSGGAENAGNTSVAAAAAALVVVVAVTAVAAVTLPRRLLLSPLLLHLLCLLFPPPAQGQHTQQIHGKLGNFTYVLACWEQKKKKFSSFLVQFPVMKVLRRKR